MGISAADFELLHDVVGAKRSWRRYQECVNLSHGAINSPGAANHAPLTYELVPGVIQSGYGIVSIVHIVSVNTETTDCQGNPFARFFESQQHWPVESDLPMPSLMRADGCVSIYPRAR